MTPNAWHGAQPGRNLFISSPWRSVRYLRPFLSGFLCHQGRDISFGVLFAGIVPPATYAKACKAMDGETGT